MEDKKSTRSKDRITPEIRINDKSDRETTDDDIFNEDDIPSSSAHHSAHLFSHQQSKRIKECTDKSTKTSSNDELIEKMEQIHNSKNTFRNGKSDQVVDSTTDKNTANAAVEIKEEPEPMDIDSTATQRDASKECANITVEKRDSASQTFDDPDSANEDQRDSANKNAEPNNSTSSEKISTYQISNHKVSTNHIKGSTYHISDKKAATNQITKSNPTAILEAVNNETSNKDVSTNQDAQKKIFTDQNSGQKDSGSTPVSQKVTQNESSTSESQIVNQATDRPTVVVDNNNSAQIIHHNLRVENESTPVAGSGEAVSEATGPPPNKVIVDNRKVDSRRVEATKRKLWTTSEDMNSRASTSAPVMSRTDVKNVKKKPVTKSKRSGLVFPVARLTRKLKKGRYARHIAAGAGVYMAAVLEYLTAEVLELSGGFTKKWKKHRIIPRAILLTLRMDYELEELCRGTIIPQGGTRPFIHNALLPKKDQVQEREQSPEFD